MNNKRRLWRIIVAAIIVTIVIGSLALRLTLNCCALPPLPSTLTARAMASAIALTKTSEVLPYDPTLYAQRRHDEDLFKTAGGPTEWAIFVATETALVETYQGTNMPTFTPIPYNADMSPTAIPLPSYTPTPTPTLCPPSDVICPGGNATLNPAQKVFVLMASAEGTEFRQLALTATALATSPTPTLHSSPSATPTATSSAHDSNCAFSWAHQDLPEAARALETAFNEAGVKSIGVIRAEAYGENCIKADGQVSYFGAMTSDFYLAATVKNLDDADELGQMITTAYNTIMALDVKLPAEPGYLDIVFSAGSQSKLFRSMFYPLKPLIEAGKRGAELLAAGGL